MIDYRNFTLKKLNTPEYNHLKLLLYWPFYGIVFMLLERVIPLEFHEIYTKLDDYIPFCEYFIIPYYFWFVFLIGMLLYTLLFDIKAFRKYMWFIMVTYSVTCIVYVIYPSMQTLRPPVFERDNIFTQIVSFLYGFDTNTNVCPSLHVIGSMAVMFAGFDCERLKKSKGWNAFFIIATVLISFSTVFLKQHSIIDVFWGFVLSAAGYVVVYRTRLFESVVKETHIPVEQQPDKEFINA